MSSLIDDLQVSVSSGISETSYYHDSRGGYRVRRTSSNIFLSFLLPLVLSSPNSKFLGSRRLWEMRINHRPQTTDPVCRFQTAGFLIETSILHATPTSP
jgi:hypothetical protein